MQSPDNNKFKIIFLVTFVLAAIISTIVFLNYQKNEYEKYPSLETETEIYDWIKNVKREHGYLMIDFFNGSKYGIISTSNYKYKPASLFFFAEYGDYIIKKKDTDTIIVKRKDIEYIFVLGKELNKR